MGKRKVPSSADPNAIILPEKIGYHVWYCPHFPVEMLGGKLDKDPQEIPWILGLLDDINTEGKFRNPVIVWNHHPARGGKQPNWLLRAGSNRVWCAEQLGWTSVPAVVSTVWKERCPSFVEARPILPMDIPIYFPDGGRIWANEHGFGLLAAKKPEITYAEFEATPETHTRVVKTGHNRTKIINPMTDN